jgi:hypothetical protein
VAAISDTPAAFLEPQGWNLRVQSDGFEYFPDHCRPLNAYIEPCEGAVMNIDSPPHAPRSISMSKTCLRSRSRCLRCRLSCLCCQPPSPVAVCGGGTAHPCDRSRAFGASNDTRGVGNTRYAPAGHTDAWTLASYVVDLISSFFRDDRPLCARRDMADTNLG